MAGGSSLAEPTCAVRQRHLTRRWLFTCLTLLALILIALATNTHVSELSTRWLHRLGFAPRDLLRLQWGRMLTSALLTSGGTSFWLSLAMVLIAVGAAEWLAGTRRAGCTFWGVHLLTLLLEAWIIAVPLRLYDGALGAALSVARDVGPSAGYFGCLGLACARLPGRWRWLSAAIWAALWATLWLPGGIGHARTLAISASLAHVIAFPLGWIAARVPLQRKRR